MIPEYYVAKIYIFSFRGKCKKLVTSDLCKNFCDIFLSFNNSKLIQVRFTQCKKHKQYDTANKINERNTIADNQVQCQQNREIWLTRSLTGSQLRPDFRTQALQS